MDTERLVRIVVAKVMEALGHGSQNPPPAPAGPLSRLAVPSDGPPTGRLLGLITGGSLGAEEAFAGLDGLMRAGYELDLILSKAAASIHDPESLRRRFAGARVYLATELESCHDLLRSCQLVTVAVLTRHTAARTALLLADTLPAALILDALMMGKPVVAARDAADISHPAWLKLGSCIPAGLKAAMQEVLRRLAHIGVELVEARDLQAAIERRLRGEVSTGARKAESRGRGVITGEAVRLAGSTPERQIEVRGALVTPLARDLARELGVRLLEEVGPCASAR